MQREQVRLREVKLTCSLAELYDRYAEEEYSLFLDSARNAYGMGRYSFVLRRPFLRLRYKDGQGCWSWADGRQERFSGKLWPELKERLAEFPTLPTQFPLAGGAVGYFSYDLAYRQEELAGCSCDERKLADCNLGFYDSLLAYDHQEERAFIVATGWPETSATQRALRAERSIAEWSAICATAAPLPKPQRPSAEGPYRSNFSREQYLQRLEQAIEYIHSGDIFQVNIAQRFSAPYAARPYDLYRYLREINPAPFAAFLPFDDCVVASASPERFLRIAPDGEVEARPIKGTRPRGLTAEDDERLRRELCASEKDRAELVMIIDLMRNDLGKVCRYGSVQVPQLFCCEQYATVHHLVSTVTGQLCTGLTATEQLAAAFPPGSITGAPKVRAMEIIDELEPTRRNVYTGTIGYLSFCGGADFNVAIRTLTIADGEAQLQAGGGIVADSQPAAEYQETLDKAKALLCALGHEL